MSAENKRIGYGEFRIAKENGTLSVSLPNGDMIHQISQQLLDRTLSDTLTEEKTVVCVPALNDLPAYEGGEIIGVYECGDGCWQLLTKCGDAATAEGYLATLQQAGYERLTEKAMADNLFYQYQKDDTVLHVLYAPATETLRVVTEPASTAVISSSDPEAFEPICTTMLTQIGLGCDAPGRVHNDHENDISLSYVLRLKDGRFVVWDGGMPWPEYEERLLTVLQNQNVLGEKPIIALWILTHAHPDHTGVFDLFADKHLNDVTVQQVMHNFHGDYQSKGLAAYHARLRRQINRFGAKLVKAHTGMELSVADAKIEVLFEHEMVAPMHVGNLNMASVVTRLWVEGQSVLFLADHADCNANEKYRYFNNGAMRRMYGAYLKSDMVQVAHHGLGGGASRELYEMIDAKFVLWPIGEAKFLYHKLGETKANSYFKREGQVLCHAFQRLYVFEWLEEGMKWKAYTSFEEYKKRIEAGT